MIPIISSSLHLIPLRNGNVVVKNSVAFFTINIGMLNLPVYLYTPAIQVFLDLENSTSHKVNIMYHGYAKISRNTKNIIQFNFRNGDQRPISVYDQEFIFQLYNPVDNSLALSKPITVLETQSTVNNVTTITNKGKTQLTLIGSDTANLQAGDYKYAVLKLDGNEILPAFVDGASTVNGVVQVVDSAVESFRPSTSLTFSAGANKSTGGFYSNSQGLGDETVHTAQLYLNNFTGDVTVYGTLENSASATKWAEITTASYSGQSTPAYVNFSGVFTYFKIDYTATAGSIDKVLYRS